MDLLRTAVVDISVLLATCQALNSMPADGEVIVPTRLRKRLRRDIKAAALAYIDTLARTKRPLVDERLLRASRVAAEKRMALAIQHQALLCQMMLSEPGSLDGLAATRQDLWHLASIATHLRAGLLALRESDGVRKLGAARVLAGKLRRRLRKALVAYALSTLRRKAPGSRPMIAARAAALKEIGPRGAGQAERLADIEAGSGSAQTPLRLGVAKPLLQLAVDWMQRPSAEPR
jgi:hypothetical protein